MNLRTLASKSIAVLGSFGLACIILILLLIIVFLGTLEQANYSLYDVQKRYFESLFVVPKLLPIPLPGGFLLLSLLFVNLVVGGMVRMRRAWSRAGIFVIHIGIALLLAGGLVEYLWSNKGHMTLYEGERSAQYESYYEWELSVAEQLPGGRERAYVIPHERLAKVGPGEWTAFEHDALPFTLRVGGYLRNCVPEPASADGGIDGFVLKVKPPAMEEERNVAGLTVSVEPPGGPPEKALLWGLQRAPHEVRVGGRRFAVDLRKRRWPLPFDVKLVRFTRTLHPRTGVPASFSSDITRLEGGVAQDVHISMNEPMRHKGYTFYQAGWGPQNAGPNDRLFSTFAVVENPADRVPWLAVSVIAFGLVVHFGRKLVLHILEQRRIG